MSSDVSVKSDLTVSELLKEHPRHTFVDEFLQSAKYSLIQSPAEAVTQLCNQTFGSNLRPRFVEKPQQAEFLSSQWHAQQLGAVAGTLPWLLALHKTVRLSSDLLIKEQTAAAVTFKGGYALSKRALLTAESATVGLGYGFALTPVDPLSRDFWADKSRNASISAVTFATMTHVTQSAKNSLFAETSGAATTWKGAALERLKMAGAGAAGGLVAAPVDAGLHSWLQKRQLPSVRELAEATYGFTLIGAGFGAATPAERISGPLADKSLEPVRVPELASLPMEKRAILDGAAKFASEITEKFPQVSADGKLNYYLAGSLGSMLLLEGKSFRPISADALPQIRPAESVPLPVEAQNSLQQFVRQIGDLDYVRVNQTAGEGMRKGGGAVLLADLSEQARQALKPWDGSSTSVFTDPVEPMVGHAVVEVEVGGRKFYVGSPEIAYACKLVHLAESMGRLDGKVMKFANDANRLIETAEQLYPQSQVDAMAYKALFEYNAKSVQGLWLPYQSPEFGGKPRALLERVLQMDPDFKHLESIQYGRERGLSFLRLLHRFPNAETKSLVVDFLNEHKTAIDQWTTQVSEANRIKVGEFLVRNPAEMAKFEAYLKPGPAPNVADLLPALRTNPWVIHESAKVMPLDALDKIPARSDVIDIMARIDVNSAAAELATLRSLLSRGADLHHVQKIFEGVSEPGLRTDVMTHLSQSKLQGPELASHLRLLSSSLDRTVLDLAKNKWVELTPAEVAAKVRSQLK